MAGLFDNLDDPVKQALITSGLLMMGGGQNFGRSLSQAGMGGLQAYNMGTARNAKLAEEKQQQEMRAMQMADMKRRQENMAYAQQIAPQFFSPGVTPATPFDDNGNPMPSSPPKADLSGYGMALAGRDPSMGMPFIQAGMKDESPLMMKPGEVALDRRTLRPLYSAPEKAKHHPGDTREIKSGSTVLTQEFDGKEWKTIGKAPLWKPEDGPKPVFNEAAGGFIVPPVNGAQPSLIPVPGLAPSQKNAPSEAELTAGGYAQRMLAANKLLSEMPETSVPGLRQTIANNKYPTLAPYVSSPGQQQYRQAQEDWVRAKLRKESGAVIADEEMAREIRVYFPQPGDSPEVIKQKADARQRANDAMIMAAGKAKGQITSPGGWSITRKD